MTLQLCYDHGMEHLSAYFLSVQGTGAAFCVGLLLACFILVHIVKLARIGYRARKKLPPAEPKPEEPREAVYYIVERKKKRAKAEYSEPKRIHFK